MHYENQILDAIEQIVDSKIANAGYDKTIQATIVNCEDATIGKYKVSYQNSVFYAYANSSEISYANGSDVYILIPNGDMSRDKTILGSTKKLGKDYATGAIGEDAFEIVGTNCIDSHDSFELCSYETTLAQVIYDRTNSDKDNNLKINIKNLEEYIKESTSITLAATVRTDLPLEQQFRGNYGIVYQIVFDDNATGEEVTRNYILDINQFEGNPYNFPNWKRQFGIFEADGKNFKYINKIYLFCYDFPNQETGERADIFIKNLELYGTVALSEEDLNSFKLSFITTQGTFFDENDKDDKATRLIEAKVRVKGKYIDNKSQILPYYWFVENNGITSLSEDYCAYGGQGWKCLNKKNIIKGANAETGTAPTVEWVPGSYQYTVTKGDNQAKETRYKCVVLYNSITLSREITITNYSSQWNIAINSDSGTEFYYDIGNPTLTCLVNGNEEIGNAYTYQWAEVDSKNNFYSLTEGNVSLDRVDSITKMLDYNKVYILTTDNYIYYYNNGWINTNVLVHTNDNDNDIYNTAVTGYVSLKSQIQAETVMAAANQIQLKAYLQIMKNYDIIRRVEKNKVYHLQVNTITAFTTYKCSVYYNGIYIGTSSIVLTNRLDKKDLYTLVINNGVQTFKYDEQGVAPTSQALENPQMIPALSFSIYDNLGNQLNEDVISKCKIKWSIPIENTLIKIPNSYEEIGIIDNGYLILEDLLEISYEISQKYDVKKNNNNNIQLTVQYKDMTLVTRTDLTFAKEGEPGTNGTEFLCKIVPNTDDVNFGYPMLENGHLNYNPINSSQWFRVQLWHSGDQIFDSVTSGITSENKTATVKWEILRNKYKSNIYDISSISVTEQGNFSYIGYQAEFNSPADIIKCTIEYDNANYYCTMPLITAIAEPGYDVELIENTGFRYATYAADGRSPQFDNSMPFTLKVTNLINGYIEDISTLQETNGVIYNWNIKGVIYDKDRNTFVDTINLELYNRHDIAIAYNQGSYKPSDDYDGECLTNALECEIKNKNNQTVARINIPIHLLLNKYGHAELNGWDGNHISIDENGSGVILAPQVGAGQKEMDPQSEYYNTFTGLLMGKVKEAEHKKQYIGLHGYSHGVRTIFLNAENGSAIFGGPKSVDNSGTGQIIIDPSSKDGLIYSSNFWINYGEDGLPSSYNSSNEAGRDGENQDLPTGMLINLSKPEIRFGNGNFKVEQNGYITAKGGGHIAGWKISNYAIDDVQNERMLDKTGKTGMNSVYDINADGALVYSVKAPVNGEPANVNKAVAFWAGEQNFFVTHDGYVKMNAASVGSKWDNPIYIGKSLDGFSAIYSGDKNKKNAHVNGFYIGTNGISLGKIVSYTDYDGNTVSASKFQVNEDGTLYAMDGTFNGRIVSDRGKIGGWTIAPGHISTFGPAGNPIVQLQAEGRILFAKNGGDITTTIDGNGMVTPWIYYSYAGRPLAEDEITNISGYMYGDNGQGEGSTTVLALASKKKSVVLYSREENIRLSAGKNIYLDAGSTGNILFKSQMSGGDWMELGSGYAKFG